MNNINRCMGQSDFYPFVLSAHAIEKLAFVHELIHRVAMAEAVQPQGKSSNGSAPGHWQQDDAVLRHPGDVLAR